MAELILEGRHLRALGALSGLRGLKRASFARNELASADGLGECSSLEQLSLEVSNQSVGHGTTSSVRPRQYWCWDMPGILKQ
jgi:hypothetical protein